MIQMNQIAQIKSELDETDSSNLDKVYELTARMNGLTKVFNEFTASEKYAKMPENQMEAEARKPKSKHDEAKTENIEHKDNKNESKPNIPEHSLENDISVQTNEGNENIPVLPHVNNSDTADVDFITASSTAVNEFEPSSATYNKVDIQI